MVDSPYSAVIFDCFGVLVNNAEIPEIAQLDEVSKKRFLEIARRADIGLLTEDETLALHAEVLGLSAQEWESRLAEGEVVNDDMTTLVTRLHALQIKTGLLSNISSRERIEKRLRKRFGSLNYLGEFFTHVAISSELGVAKPNSEIFHQSLKALGESPEKALFVDDSAANLEGAEKVGLNVFHFTGSNQDFHELEALIGLKDNHNYG